MEKILLGPVCHLRYASRLAGVAITLLLAAAPAWAGGGWTRQKGHGYAKVGLTLANTSKYHPLAGGIINTAQFQQQVYSLYAEYGLTNRLEATLNFPFFRRATFPSTSPGQGVGDPEFGLRYGVLTGKWPLAVQVAAQAPLGNPNAVGIVNNDPANFVYLPTGNGQWNIWTRAALSHTLGTLPAFITLEAGYNFRTAGFTNQYSYGAQLGYKFFDKLWLTAAVRTLDNVRAPDPAKLARIGLGEGVAYSAASLGASYAITKRIAATADVAAGFGKLRNVYSGLQSTFGVAVEW
ncbi:hypothetical protein ACFP2F_15230 [Hymenobacter artigasi]|uniref:Transporter n=1 Tax=Hymenobacter artigasi TaxID=2719616 RepID=A0ABX1HPZ2_9BACT|nr:hypothetical protein [Hymenobacter artigasi]NKI91071.1 hypothetical protein [Hymenobacter artigasi]